MEGWIALGGLLAAVVGFVAYRLLKTKRGSGEPVLSHDWTPGQFLEVQVGNGGSPPGFTGRSDVKPDVEHLADWLKRVAEGVNDAVNRDFVYRDLPVTDPLNWKPGLVGDCDVSACEKRQRLVQAGVKPGALRLACAGELYGYHVLLILRTSQGDFALDMAPNETRILPATRTRYGRLWAMERPGADFWDRVV